MNNFYTTYPTTCSSRCCCSSTWGSLPILKVKFEFPYVIYQGLTIYLLIAIGWHGGEELASLSRRSTLQHAGGFMVVGFCSTSSSASCLHGLRMMTRCGGSIRRRWPGYYGSDSAGTFVTCLGVLAAANITYDAYMPVMLAVMEIPGCLVALTWSRGCGTRGWTRATCPTSPATTRHEATAILVRQRHSR